MASLLFCAWRTSFFLETPSLLERRTDAGNDGIGAVSEAGRESSPYGIFIRHQVARALSVAPCSM